MNILVCWKCNSSFFVKANTDSDKDKCLNCGVIHTNLSDFKKLSLDQVNGEQIRLMRHALGLNDSDFPYRNYFCTYGADEQWNDLLEKGFAEKTNDFKDTIIYSLTYAATVLVYGKSISYEEYEKL